MVRILIDYDEADKKVIFASANIANLGHKVQSTFPSDSHLDLIKNGCVPVFALYRDKVCVSVIVGVDAPQLLTQVDFHFPDKVFSQ